MDYFGGLGAGKGWLKFLFLVEPDLLREVLAASKAVLVVTGTRVPINYSTTPLDEYIAAYSRYVEANLESVESAHRASSDIYMGVASPHQRFTESPCPDTRYKLLGREEPVANLMPLMLDFDAQRGQLRTNVMSRLYFGIELSFPRVISLSRERHEILHETQEYSTFGVFTEIQSLIRKRTKPCRFISPAREHRTSIRITDPLRERMKAHPGLAAAGLRIV